MTQAQPQPSKHDDWTINTYAAHNEALRLAEDKFQAERDRRYSEVKASDEKALLVKERGDRDALELARAIQTFKDEKANELREQINRERNTYATKTDLVAATEKLEAVIAPMAAYIATQQGGSKGMRDMWGWITAAILAAVTLLKYWE